ncbi:MAG: Methyltransferase type 11 [Firmicutes bacterium]|nr:Methyltransferase type 11 [Bacillota bacterium]
MTLVEEYKNQNRWRDWGRYLDKIPLDKNQIVYDLGCGMGDVSRMLSYKVKRVVGFDNNTFLLEAADKNKPNNCKFIVDNIFTLDPSKLEKCDGIWTSFAMAYMESPNLFLSNWVKALHSNGWFAIVDIDGLFSNHLPQHNRYFRDIDLFEKEAETSKIYDFRIGKKIKKIMEYNGLDIIVAEEDWYDRELNFKGKASPEVVEAWKNRLERMVRLKTYLGDKYSSFSKELLHVISEEDHKSHGGVKFYVGIKR